MGQMELPRVLTKVLGLLVLSIVASVGYAAESKIGLLFSSYGDIDDPSEAKDYVIRTLTDPDLIPLPSFLREKIANVGWSLREGEILAKYRAIGGRTNYRTVSQKQADAIAAKLRQAGYDVRGYTGFLFTYPFIGEALDRARRDGVHKVIVINQGAQNSTVTTGLEFRNVRQYLQEHPDWDVKVTGIRSFANDRRFFDLLAQSIQRRLNRSFSSIPARDICIFLPMHGNLMHWIENGDPSYQQMLDAVQEIRTRFPSYRVFYGFLNNDDIPIFPWTQPKDSYALRDMVAQGCSQILINGRISFTIDSIESLYDQAIVESQLTRDYAREFGYVAPKVTVEPMFNLEPEFIDFQAQLIKEAILGHGDLEWLNEGLGER